MINKMTTEQIYDKCFERGYEACQSDEIRQNRMKFIEKHEITARSNVNGLRGVRGAYSDTKWLDHVRAYKGKGKWVLVSSPYEPDTIESMTKNAEMFGFNPTDPVYNDGSNCFYRVFYSIREINECINKINATKYQVFRG